ncbi:MAG: type II toxin-antitoxin system RelE family toxin [Bacteriovoracia bacterium]
MNWRVEIKHKVAKALKDPRKIPPDVASAVLALIVQLEVSGPAVNWPHYGKLRNQGNLIDRRHCHLRRGRPTWVCCWEVEAKLKLVEVYYVGTHEKAPY